MFVSDDVTHKEVFIVLSKHVVQAVNINGYMIVSEKLLPLFQGIFFRANIMRMVISVEDVGLNYVLNGVIGFNTIIQSGVEGTQRYDVVPVRLALQLPLERLVGLYGFGILVETQNKVFGNVVEAVINVVSDMGYAIVNLFHNGVGTRIEAGGKIIEEQHSRIRKKLVYPYVSILFFSLTRSYILFLL